VDRACDCCGFECIDAEGNNVENIIITQAIAVTRVGGGIAITGFYNSNDAGAATKQEAQGILPVPIGDWWIKGQSLRGGAITSDLYRSTQLLLKKLIERDHAKPSFVFDREFRIEDAPEAFRLFSEHKLVKAVFRFDKEGNKDGNGNGNGNGEAVRDPLQGEPVKKQSRRSYNGHE